MGRFDTVRRLLAVGLGVVAAATMTSCKEQGTAAGGGGAGQTITIGVVAKSDGNPVFLAAKVGAEAAARELGPEYGVTVKIDWRTPPSEDAQKQAEAVDALASLGADGIAISCTDANLLTAAIDSAVDKGLEVVTFDSDAPNSKRLAYYGVDDKAAGAKVMAELAKVMPEGGKVAILGGNQAAVNLQARVAGVEEEAAKHADISIHDTFFFQPETTAEAVATMQRVQTANPDIAGWALVGGWPLYTDNALDGIHETAKVVSMDPLEDPLNYVRAGQVQALVGQPYYGWGYESVRLLLDKLVKGENPQEMNFAEFDVVYQENVDEFAKNWDKWLGR